MGQHPVTHFEVNARDAKATQKFYSDLFGWSVNTNNPMNYGMVETNTKGHGINGGIGASQDGRSWITFYVETPDPAGTLAKAERLGGRTVLPPMAMGPGTYALFADPEGNVIGLYKDAGAQTKPASGPRTRARKPAAKKKATARKSTARKRTAARRRR